MTRIDSIKEATGVSLQELSMAAKDKTLWISRIHRAAGRGTDSVAHISPKKRGGCDTFSHRHGHIVFLTNKNIPLYLFRLQHGPLPLHPHLRRQNKK